MCVRESARKREQESERDRERDGESERERESETERARERKRKSEPASETEVKRERNSERGEKREREKARFPRFLSLSLFPSLAVSFSLEHSSARDTKRQRGVGGMRQDSNIAGNFALPLLQFFRLRAAHEGQQSSWSWNISHVCMQM